MSLCIKKFPSVCDVKTAQTDKKQVVFLATIEDYGINMYGMVLDNLNKPGLCLGKMEQKIQLEHPR